MTMQTASPEASLLEASLFHHAHLAHEAQCPQSAIEAMDESLAFGEVSQLEPCSKQALSLVLLDDQSRRGDTR